MSTIMDALQKAGRANVFPGEGFRSSGNEKPLDSSLRFVEEETVSAELEAPLSWVLQDGAPWIEQLRVLKAQLRDFQKASRIRCVGITSAGGDEGKTTIALALAMLLSSDEGKEVLLVDADLRKSSTERHLGIEPRPGLSEWLECPTPKPPVRRLQPCGTLFLSAGKSSQPPARLLKSDRLESLLAAAREQFDYVIVDCPPLVPVADTASMQDAIEGFLLVVRARMVPRETLLMGFERIKQSKILGVIFNDARRILANYYDFGTGYYSEVKCGE